jgi:omega-6 fatty acid desaturase (delta-12 desaturase)
MTLTVAEYRARDRWGRLAYRLYRHPLVLFGLGPLWLFIGNRWPSPGTAIPALHATGVHATNAVLALAGALLAFTLGIGPVLLVYLPAYFLAVVAGIWLFYVQHQFAGTYWETDGNWDYATAALHGSSYYRLPRVLEWMTGRIGLHHIHHIDPRIPNYELRRCHDETREFRDVPEMTLWRSFRSVRLKLWDTEQGRMVGFDAARDRDRR